MAKCEDCGYVESVRCFPGECGFAAALRHLREDAGPDSCADYIVRNKQLEARIRTAVALIDDTARLHREGKRIPGLITVLDMYRAALAPDAGRNKE